MQISKKQQIWLWLLNIEIMDKFVLHQVVFYIHTSKKEQFTKSFVDKTLKLKIGNGMNKDVQLGPITTKKKIRRK